MTALFDSLLERLQPGSPVHIRITERLFRVVDWESILTEQGAYKVFFHIEDARLFENDNDFARKMIKFRRWIFGITTDGRGYLHTPCTYREIIANGYLKYETLAIDRKGELAYMPKINNRSVFGSEIVVRAAHNRMNWYALQTVAAAFRFGYAYLDEGRCRIPRDVGLLIATHIVCLPQWAVRIEHEVRPATTDPRVVAYQMLHRDSQKRDLPDEVREVMERFVRRRFH